MFTRRAVTLFSIGILVLTSPVGGAMRSDLVAAVAEATNTTENEAQEQVDAVFAAIVHALARGERVDIAGFGSFDLKHTAERIGRNPQTGEQITIPASRRIYFKPAKDLGDALGSAALGSAAVGDQAPPAAGSAARELGANQGFLMAIEDVLSVPGRGTLVTGRVERGVVKVGDEVEILGLRETAKTMVTGIEVFRRVLDQAEAGDNVGVFLRGVGGDDVERGQVLAKPGSIQPHTRFRADLYVLTNDEGGRHTPFFQGYRPQFYFRTKDVTGAMTLPEGTEMVMPGDHVTLEVSLVTTIALEEGLQFSVREGGRTVGAGTVTEILE